LVTKAYHEKRSDDPVHEDAESNLHPNGAFLEDTVQRLVFDLAKDWIHHDEKTNRCTG
jgi:hypothetical protein